jgi:hypothetical protein
MSRKLIMMVFATLFGLFHSELTYPPMMETIVNFLRTHILTPSLWLTFFQYQLSIRNMQKNAMRNSHS